ncbi:MAG: hypothetical protein EXS14_10780 [Planctomycetes bacterium]|nr:hypothetical protein [Planctomycetota bacterium]
MNLAAQDGVTRFADKRASHAAPTHSPLGMLGALLLGAGFALTLLVPPVVVGPLPALLPLVLIVLGSVTLLLQQALQGLPDLGFAALLLPLAALPGMLPGSHEALQTGTVFVCVALGTLALRGLVQQGCSARELLRPLLALLCLCAVIGLAQTLYQRDAVQHLATESGHDLLATEKGRAFLASDRATGPLQSANTFAAVLLLLLPLACCALLQKRAAAQGRAATLMTRAAALLPAALLAAAFVAAGSAGAFLAAAATAPFFLRVSRGVVRCVLLSLMLVGVGALVLWLLAVCGVPMPEFMALKILSLRERVDFQCLAVRIFADWSPEGIGFGTFAVAGEGVLRPGEAWSSSAHNAWLQLLLEGGLAPLGAVVGLFLIFRRRTPAAFAASTTPHSLSRAFSAGAFSGTLLAPLAVPMLSPLPLTLESPSWAALSCALLFLFFLHATRCVVQLENLRTPLAFGLAAFTFHGFVDSDLFIPGACAAAGWLFALALPITDTQPAHRGLAPLSVVVALLCVAWCCRAAWHADLRAEALEAHAAGDDKALQFLATQHGGALEALEFAGPAIAVKGIDAVDAALAEIPARLRASPRGRVLEARMLVRAAEARRASLSAVRTRVAALSAPDDRRQPTLLRLRARIAQLGGDASAQADFERRAAAQDLRWQP